MYPKVADLSNTVLIKNLLPDVTENELVELFSTFGSVLSISIARHFETGCSLGFACVVFENFATAMKVMSFVDNWSFCGKPLCGNGLPGSIMFPSFALGVRRKNRQAFDDEVKSYPTDKLLKTSEDDILRNANPQDEGMDLKRKNQELVGVPRFHVDSEKELPIREPLKVASVPFEEILKNEEDGEEDQNQVDVEEGRKIENQKQKKRRMGNEDENQTNHENAEPKQPIVDEESINEEQKREKEDGEEDRNQVDVEEGRKIEDEDQKQRRIVKQEDNQRNHEKAEPKQTNVEEEKENKEPNQGSFGKEVGEEDQNQADLEEGRKIEDGDQQQKRKGKEEYNQRSHENEEPKQTNVEEKKVDEEQKQGSVGKQEENEKEDEMEDLNQVDVGDGENIENGDQKQEGTENEEEEQETKNEKAEQIDAKNEEGEKGGKQKQGGLRKDNGEEGKQVDEEHAKGKQQKEEDEVIKSSLDEEEQIIQINVSTKEILRRKDEQETKKQGVEMKDEKIEVKSIEMPREGDDYKEKRAVFSGKEEDKVQEGKKEEQKGERGVAEDEEAGKYNNCDENDNEDEEDDDLDYCNDKKEEGEQRKLNDSSRIAEEKENKNSVLPIQLMQGQSMENTCQSNVTLENVSVEGGNRKASHVALKTGQVKSEHQGIGDNSSHERVLAIADEGKQIYHDHGEEYNDSGVEDLHGRFAQSLLQRLGEIELQQVYFNERYLHLIRSVDVQQNDDSRKLGELWDSGVQINQDKETFWDDYVHLNVNERRLFPTDPQNEAAHFNERNASQDGFEVDINNNYNSVEDDMAMILNLNEADRLRKMPLSHMPYSKPGISVSKSDFNSRSHKVNPRNSTPLKSVRSQRILPGSDDSAKDPYFDMIGPIFAQKPKLRMGRNRHRGTGFLSNGVSNADLCFPRFNSSWKSEEDDFEDALSDVGSSFDTLSIDESESF